MSHNNNEKWLALSYPGERRSGADPAFARQLQDNTRQWCKEHFSKDISQLEKTLAKLDTGLFSALVYPGAGRKAAQFASDFMAWWFLLDDRLESSRKRRQSEKKRHALFRSYIASLEGSHAFGDIEDCFVPAARELGRRLPQFARPELCKRFCHAMKMWLFEGIEKEPAICGDPSKTDVDSYFHIRPFSSGVLPTLYLGELASAEMPFDKVHSLLLDAFLKKAGEIIYLGNDIFSYHKEVKRPCNFNLAMILKREKAISEQSALLECARYHNEAVSEYLELKARLEESGAGAWLQGMDDVLSGLILWQQSA
ncbi:MAG: hypothetical protein OEV42_01295, partial [Deltaproteobacteria bacterium]|nr:hypothetical protein [Deltaproteobacteria bacterium]